MAHHVRCCRCGQESRCYFYDNGKPLEDTGQEVASVLMCYIKRPLWLFLQNTLWQQKKLFEGFAEMQAREEEDFKEEDL